jgi:hypothetical protein
MTSAIARRLSALEDQRRPVASYVVRLPDETLGDPAAKHAAIIGHRRLTGWMGPVILAPMEMTEAEWLARSGQAPGR